MVLEHVISKKNLIMDNIVMNYGINIIWNIKLIHCIRMYLLIELFKPELIPL